MHNQITNFYSRLRDSPEVNKVFCSLSLWLLLIIAQMSHVVYLHYNKHPLSELIFLQFSIDWKTAAALAISGILVYFIATKFNKQNLKHQSLNQNLIEGELASAAMNFGGALLLNASTQFLGHNDAKIAIIFVVSGISVYIASWFLIPN